MEGIQERRLTFFRTAGLFAVLAVLLLPTTASAADSIYWSNEKGSDSIRVGNLDGSVVASTSPKTLFDDGGAPCGVALNPAAGKIYWANWSPGEIRVANLDGTGGPGPVFAVNPVAGNACGVAVDPANNKIYWANFSTSEIWVGNLDGTGTASILFTDPPGSGPSGVAIDPAGGKIYWTNQPADQVRVGNLDGSGFASTLFGAGCPTEPAVPCPSEDNPIGVAVNPAAGKIYWTDLHAGTVRVGPLGGDTVNPGDEASTLFNTSSHGPSGPAIDPTANKIYWASWQSNLGIRVGSLDGTGTASTLFDDPPVGPPFEYPEGNSLFTALLKKPAFERPGISGGPKIGNELTCQVQFAPDLLGAFLYRAPHTVAYQWKKGTTVVGTNAPTFTPTAPVPGAGDYTCTVTATNQAETTVQTSAVKKVKK